MSEPTNEELRQACELIGRIENSPHNDWAMADCYGGKEAFLVARALLSRLDREAEAERLLKVAREAIEKAPHSDTCESRVIMGRWFGYGKCDCWKSRALAEIAPAAPEGPKP